MTKHEKRGLVMFILGAVFMVDPPFNSVEFWFFFFFALVGFGYFYFGDKSS